MAAERSSRFGAVLVVALALAGALEAAPAVAQTASVSVEKIDAPDPVLAGGNLAYTITVSNEGPASAANATLTDTLPAGTTFISLTAPGGWSCTTPAVGAAGTVNCTNAAAPVGSDIFTLVVAVAAGTANGSTISNTATISTTTTDPDPNDNVATAVTAVATQADLSVLKSDAPDPVLPGASLTYGITVVNSGPSNAASVALNDVLPAGVVFASLTAPGGWSCTTPSVGASGTVGCSHPSLPPGSAIFTLVVTVSSGLAGGSTITNTATIAAATADPNPANNVASAVTAVRTPAALSATKTVGGTFVPGGGVVYTITLSNAGPGNQGDNAGNEFTDVLPATLALTGASSSSGTTTSNLVSNTVTWNGAIPAGGSVTISITATISPAIVGMLLISNQGQISFDADGNGTNEATAVTDDPSRPGNQDATVFVANGLVAAIPAMGLRGWLILAALVLFAAWRTLALPVPGRTYPK